MYYWYMMWVAITPCTGTSSHYRMMVSPITNDVIATVLLLNDNCRLLACKVPGVLCASVCGKLSYIFIPFDQQLLSLQHGYLNSVVWWTYQNQQESTFSEYWHRWLHKVKYVHTWKFLVKTSDEVDRYTTNHITTKDLTELGKWI